MFFHPKNADIFLISPQKYVVVPLEVPPRGTCNECPQHMFLLRNKKNISSFLTEFLDFRIDYYRIYHMYSDRQAWANSLDPDETLRNAVSHLGLHCLPLIQQFLDTTSGSKLYWFKFRTYMVRSWGVRILRVNTVATILNPIKWVPRTCFYIEVGKLLYGCLLYSEVQSTLIISNSKGLTETLRDIRTST